MPREIGSLGFTKGMALRDAADVRKNDYVNSSTASRRGLRDGMRRWTNGLPGATARLGAMMAHEVYPSVSLGCARIPMLARSICSTQRPDTLMQLFSFARSAPTLRRTAGPYIMARYGRLPRCSNSVRNWGVNGLSTDVATRTVRDEATPKPGIQGPPEAAIYRANSH